MFNFDFSVHVLWGELREDPLNLHYMTDRQQPKNIKIENTVETKTPASWIPLR